MTTYSKSGRAVTGRQSINPKTYATPAHVVPKLSKAKRKENHRDKMKSKREVRHSMWLHSVPWYSRQMLQRNPKRHAAVLLLSRQHPKHPDFRGIC